VTEWIPHGSTGRSCWSQKFRFTGTVTMLLPDMHWSGQACGGIRYLLSTSFLVWLTLFQITEARALVQLSHCFSLWAESCGSVFFSTAYIGPVVTKHRLRSLELVCLQFCWWRLSGWTGIWKSANGMGLGRKDDA
jgi:hypothetical protein